jgi:hypothetical protein
MIENEVLKDVLMKVRDSFIPQTHILFFLSEFFFSSHHE